MKEMITLKQLIDTLFSYQKVSITDMSDYHGDFRFKGMASELLTSPYLSKKVIKILPYTYKGECYLSIDIE